MLINEVRVYTCLCLVLLASRQSGLKDRTLRCTVCIYSPQGSFGSWPCYGIPGIKIFYYLLQSFNAPKTDFNTYHTYRAVNTLRLDYKKIFNALFENNCNFYWDPYGPHMSPLFLMFEHMVQIVTYSLLVIFSLSYQDTIVRPRLSVSFQILLSLWFVNIFHSTLYL